MSVLIITFALAGLSEEAYRQHAASMAPRFLQVPWLISKVWLADAAANTYGGVYLFEDRPSLEAYRNSDIVAAIRANPHFEHVSVRTFGTIEEATAITGGPLTQVYAGW